LTFWVDLPDLVFFVTQVLVGGMLMESGTVQSVYRLATTQLSNRYDSHSEPLFKQTRLNGWPEALDHNCENAGNFLRSIMADWKWLSAVFGGTYEVETGISAYYQLLSFLNFLSLAKRGNLEDGTNPFMVRVPLTFIIFSTDAAKSGYQLLVRQASFLQVLLKENGIDQSKLESLWPKWIAENNRWIQGASRGRLLYWQIPYASLPSDLRSSSYQL